jgi:multiple sugar transport system permease protein/raffinose/stachyose/melibiose transport system permease protein
MSTLTSRVVANLIPGARPASRHAKLQRWLGRDIAGYFLIAPAYIIYLVFILAPVLFVVVLSFTSYRLTGEWRWVGASNFIEMWMDEVFIAALIHTFEYSIATILPSLALGLVLAVLLNRQIAGATIFRQLFYSPNVISTVATAVAWLWILDPSNGFLNRLLSMLGLPTREWLYDPQVALPALCLLGIWRSMGFNMVIYLAALQSIPRELFEAARVDGAREREVFWHVILPLLQPTTFFLLIMGFINGFQVFDQIFIMTQGGPANSTTTLVHQIYLQAFFYHRMGYASAIATVLMLVVATITIFNFKYGQQGKIVEVS